MYVFFSFSILCPQETDSASLLPFHLTDRCRALLLPCDLHRFANVAPPLPLVVLVSFIKTNECLRIPEGREGAVFCCVSPKRRDLLAYIVVIRFVKRYSALRQMEEKRGESKRAWVGSSARPKDYRSEPEMAELEGHLSEGLKASLSPLGSWP
ncbi:hypothetical protein L249_0430 [Ophiocordyceps polyrhachis-furcata BCC 54312]|uniref:Uncharacterized protein n=1 Tax=Ophiocordyceps polyrhachis-furcata BCC 54312 TaxID=1330021 RepID=A0A367LDG7_9HYPO|nr:hypothetical protein L249_0430 [Ophiocordyceps polyrhachis-furcata BCC 54312]